MVSKLCELATTPALETRPWEGLNPRMPQNAAGVLTHPTVSVPTHVIVTQMISL